MSIKFHNILTKSNNIKVVYATIALLLTYFGSWLPDFQNVMGIENAIISSTAIFGPLNGMLLGPYLGGMITFVGISAHFITSPERLEYSTFFLISPLFVVLSSIIAGFLIRQKENIVICIYSLLIVGWYLFDVGREVFYYVWFHLLILLIFILIFKQLWSRSNGIGIYTFLTLLLISLMGVLSDHLTGSVMSLLLKEIPANYYSGVIFLYPVERFLLAFAAAFIMYLIVSVVYYTLNNMNMIEGSVETDKKKTIKDYVSNDVKRVLEEEMSRK